MRREFIESSYFQSMRLEILSGYRKIGHAIDNYGYDMSKGLIEALQRLQSALEAVDKQMEADCAK